MDEVIGITQLVKEGIMEEKVNHSVVIPENWGLLIFTALILAASILFSSTRSTIYGHLIDIGIVAFGLGGIYSFWKRIEILPGGIIITRFSLFRRAIRWSQVFQVVETYIGDDKDRKVLLVILRSAPIREKFKKGQDVHAFVLSNISHAFYVEYPEGQRQSIRDSIEQFWGRIDEPV